MNRIALQIMTPEDERRNFTKMYNLMKLKDLNTLLPAVIFHPFVPSAFNESDVTKGHFCIKFFASN